MIINVSNREKNECPILIGNYYNMWEDSLFYCFAEKSFDECKLDIPTLLDSDKHREISVMVCIDVVMTLEWNTAMRFKNAFFPFRVFKDTHLQIEQSTLLPPPKIVKPTQNIIDRFESLSPVFDTASWFIQYIQNTFKEPKLPKLSDVFISDSVSEYELFE